jgi:fatty-acyl-CoA synthase
MDRTTKEARLSYEHGASPAPLLGQTVGDNLRATAQRHPDGEALVVCWQGYRATYRQLWEATGRAARALLALGVAAGDRVGIWSSNRYEWVIVQYAAARVGALLVNINPSYQAGELEYALRQSGTRVLLHGPGFRKTCYAPLLEEVCPRCPELAHVIPLETAWESFLAGGEPVSEEDLRRREAELQFDDPINIQYTSGTTGNPKGATLTHLNLLNNGYFTGLALGYGPDDRVCIPVPFYHCFGMVLGNLACTAHGACMVIPAECFQPKATLEAVAAERCTSLYGVPTMFRAVLEEPDFARYDCTSLRTGIMAGAPCPLELMREVVSQLHMPEVAIGYGMTETSPLSTMSGRDDPLEQRVGSVGRVLPHLEICLRDPASGRVVPRGTPAEFCTRGYSVMRGYWNDPQATAAAIDRAGWMHSGDLAVMEESGHVHIVGRLKDLIIRGGENISPTEIEEVLHAHPDVCEAQVVGVPSRKYGEEVMAWLRLRAGAACGDEELVAHCRARLAGFKVPRYWRCVESFPMTVTGKIQKFRLRQMAVELLGLHEAAAEKTA